jgi:hypothetical protein
MYEGVLRFRSSHRFPTAYPVVFAGAPFVGEGRLSDLSLTGCAVTTDRTVLIGSYVKLSLLLPNQPTALLIELGRIRWVRGQAFGVEFIRLPSITRQQLDRKEWERLIIQLAACAPVTAS